MNLVERINENMFTINGILAEVNEGRVEFANGSELDYYQYRAICEFIECEEQNLRILARKTVKKVLKELGIKSYEDE